MAIGQCRQIDRRLGREYHQFESINLDRSAGMRAERVRLTIFQRSAVLMAAFLLFGSVAAWGRNELNRPIANQVSADEIERHIKFLASDELQGRRAGTPAC